MAPERILGGEYGIHSEIWSLGVSILEMALGRFPYLPVSLCAYSFNVLLLFVN